MEKIIKIISNHSAVSEININSSDELAAIGIDSLGMVELIVDLEDEFDIQIDDSKLDPNMLKRVKDIINLVKNYNVSEVNT